jgi:hypothetical protein
MFWVCLKNWIRYAHLNYTCDGKHEMVGCYLGLSEEWGTARIRWFTKMVHYNFPH